MKLLKTLFPYMYFVMVTFVVFHNTGYNASRMLDVPYILYILLAALCFIVIRMIINESAAD